MAPIESIPLDGGWIGLVFILVNGFLLSYVLTKEETDTTERLLLSIGLGFGLNFAVLVLVGVLWEFSLSTILLTQIVLLISLSVAAVYRGMEQNFKGVLPAKRYSMKLRINILTIISIVVIATYLAVAAYKALSLPATEWDSLAYGVNYAKIIFEKHVIPLIAGPSLGIEMAANYPPGVQLTAAFLYAFAGNANDFYFRILSPIFGLATMLGTYEFAVTVGRNRSVAVFAAFALSALPFFWQFFIQETYMMGLTCMLTLSTLFLFKAYDAKSGGAKKYEVLGALFCGFAALTSYIGIFSFGFLLLYAINSKLSLKRLGFLIILALLVTIPWYARNLILLGNPIYPFFGIGKYLDPLLRSSTVEHFQSYTTLPFFFWISLLSKLGASILAVVIAYLTFSKTKNLFAILPSHLRQNLVKNIPSSLQKNFFIILPLYLWLVGTIVMSAHIPFPRYLIIAFPCSAVVFAVAVPSFFNMRNVVRTVAVGLILVVGISNALILPYMNYAKPAARLGDDEWSYLTHVFEEADAWEWINKNTPTDARIATFDIKEYYIERDVMPLDGNESAPLYRIDNIEDAIDFLQGQNVTHVLSVPWASIGDARMPFAYEISSLTRYLGDPLYLPQVYVGANGTTVYNVGPIDEKTIYEAFARNGSAPPLKHVTLNLTLTNSNSSNAKLCLPIPVDYRNGTLTMKVNSADLYIRLWNPQGEFVTPANRSVSQFKWNIDRAGYFTLTFSAIGIVNRDFNVTLDWTYSNPIWELSSP